MTLAAILILIVSAFMHASWNFISKKGKPSAAFFLVANSMGCLVLIPVCVAGGLHHAALFPPRAWILLVVTGMFQALYYTSLAGAYRAGDISLAYPLARALPAIVVALLTSILGHGSKLSSLCVMGIVLVVAGCFLVPINSFRDFHVKRYFCRTCAFALLAAMGTAGYSIIDSQALGLIRQELGEGDRMVIATTLYAFVEAVSASLFLLLYVSLRRAERSRLTLVLRARWRTALFAGTGIYLTYTLVLVSMTLVRNVSYVVGFRQLSIPLGVVMGIALLKEPAGKPKILGVCILLTGLLLIAIG